jgi:hypothetical protein
MSECLGEDIHCLLPKEAFQPELLYSGSEMTKSGVQLLIGSKKNFVCRVLIRPGFAIHCIL